MYYGMGFFLGLFQVVYCFLDIVDVDLSDKEVIDFFIVDFNVVVQFIGYFRLDFRIEFFGEFMDKLQLVFVLFDYFMCYWLFGCIIVDVYLFVVLFFGDQFCG